MPPYEDAYYMHNCRYMWCIKQHLSNIWSSIHEKVKLSKTAKQSKLSCKIALLIKKARTRKGKKQNLSICEHILFDKNNIYKNAEIQTFLCNIFTVARREFRLSIRYLTSMHKTYFLASACSFILKRYLTQMFSCEFCEISKNTFFKEHLWVTASADLPLWASANANM